MTLSRTHTDTKAADVAKLLLLNKIQTKYGGAPTNPKPKITWSRPWRKYFAFFGHVRWRWSRKRIL